MGVHHGYDVAARAPQAHAQAARSQSTLSDSCEPLIAIITPAYNLEHFLEETIRSVLWQTHQNWQWWIVDDGSDDATAAIVARWAEAEARIHLLRNSRQGCSAARNRAFAEAKRAVPALEFVAFLDGDDVWEPHALKTLLALARRYPGCPAVNGWATLMDENSCPLPTWPLPRMLRAREWGITTFEMLREECFIWNPGQFLIRRAALDAIVQEDAAPFHRTQTCGEDWDVWLRLSRRGAIVSEPVDVIRYRRHPAQITHNEHHVRRALEWMGPRWEGDTLSTLPDPLHRTEIVWPETSLAAAAPAAAPVCIATVASAGFVDWLQSFLGSVQQNAQMPDALIAVFNLDADAACHTAIERARGEGQNVREIACRTLARPAAWSKSVLYSIASVVDARRYLCFDCDVLVLASLRPLLGALDVLAEDALLVAENHNGQWAKMGDVRLPLRDYIRYGWYGGSQSDWGHLIGEREDAGAAQYPLLVNDGVFAGSRATLLKLDATLRTLMPRARAWLDGGDLAIRNQFLFNLALAQNRCGVRLDDAWNVQLHAHRDTISETEGRVTWEDGRPARVLHFTADTKTLLPELRARYRLG